MTRGTVVFWHSLDGWGGIETPGRPGTGFVHFSDIRGIGLHELRVGDVVEFEWLDDSGQDGCQWRVAWVQQLTRPTG
jgi:cold shock CspA family protein